MPAVMPATLAPRPAGAARDALLPADIRQRLLRMSRIASRQYHLQRLQGREPKVTGRWRHVGQYNIVFQKFQFDPEQLPAFELPPRYQNVPTPPNLHLTAYGSVAPGNDPSSGLAANAGAMVLALAALVLLAAVLEHCLDRRIFKQDVREEGTEACLESPDVPLPPGDPPPPYSMCLPKSRQDPSAEPPPPYSACYVAFGPHDLPTVHLNVPTSHSFQDTGQMSHTHNSDVSVTSEVARGSNGDLSADPAELRPNRGEASQGASTMFPNSPLA